MTGDSRRILGIDPGLNVTGYAVVEAGQRGPRVREAGVLRGPKSKLPLAARIRHLYDEVAEIVGQFQPTTMVVEQLYAHYKHPRTAILMAHARGVILLAGDQRGLSVRSYNATTIKKTVTGSGRASKSQMQRAIQRELSLPKLPDPPDVADALAVALCEYHLGGRAQEGPMITRITGAIVRVLDEDIRLQVGPFEYQVLVPECVRRQLQTKTGEITLFTTEYLEGSQMTNRMVPRLVGFTSEAELEFFELFCTVEKIGVKKALKALARPVKEIADAIHRQDTKWLTTLPGIGGSTSEQIVATLRKKVTRFALMPAPAGSEAAAGLTPAEAAQGDILADAYNALLSVGHTPADARDMLDKATASGKSVASVEDILMLIYQKR